MSEQFKDLVEFRSGKAFPEWAKDGITTRSPVTLDWRDRIKLLFGWTLEVETFTATEHEVGRTETKGCVRVFNPRKVNRRTGGFASITTLPVQSCRRYPGVCKKPDGHGGPCFVIGADYGVPGGDRTVETVLKGTDEGAKVLTVRTIHRCPVFSDGNLGQCLRNEGHDGDHAYEEYPVKVEPSTACGYCFRDGHEKCPIHSVPCSECGGRAAHVAGCSKLPEEKRHAAPFAVCGKENPNPMPYVSEETCIREAGHAGHCNYSAHSRQETDPLDAVINRHRVPADALPGVARVQVPRGAFNPPEGARMTAFHANPEPSHPCGNETAGYGACEKPQGHMGHCRNGNVTWDGRTGSVFAIEPIG